MLKVLFFLESLSGGGAEKVLTTLIKHLDKAKFDITVLCVVNTGVYVDDIEKHCKYKYMLPDYSRVNNIFGKIRYKILYKKIYNTDTYKIYKKYVKEKYDIEIAFIEGFATKFIASSPNKKSRKICWVHTDMICNTHADACYSSLDEEKNVYEKYHKIIAVSESVRDNFLKKFKFNKKDNVLVQYNPVDESDIINKSKESIDLNKPDNILLGTIGRLEEQKGYIRLVKCINRIIKKNMCISLWIIGEGNQRKVLEEYISKNNLENYITLIGFKKNPYAYLNKCDCFICSSYAEGFSTAATESLILHKPIFTVDCAGMRELFGKYKCGEIVGNNDEALYNMLENIAEEKICIDNYNSDIKKRAENFKIAIRIKEIEEIIKE